MPHRSASTSAPCCTAQLRTRGRFRLRCRDGVSHTAIIDEGPLSDAVVGLIFAGRGLTACTVRRLRERHHKCCTSTASEIVPFTEEAHRCIAINIDAEVAKAAAASALSDYWRRTRGPIAVRGGPPRRGQRLPHTEQFRRAVVALRLRLPRPARLARRLLARVR
jgi:hypothetical protein